MSSDSSEAPLRAELFSLSQLEAHATWLARTHELGTADRHDALLERLTANQAALAEAYALVADAVARGRQITPAAEWFVDNYHLIEEQIRLARRHLPPNYSRALPYLVDRSPRVYRLALDLIAHSHGHVDVAVLCAYIAAYQTVKPLQLGELWAIPIMLRLALIENLRRVIAAVSAGRRDREAAARWSDALLEGAAGDPSKVVATLAKLTGENPPLDTPFVAELASRLQGQGAIATLPMAWLEQRLENEGKSVEGVFQSAIQSQASDQISVGNSITSLRTLDAIDWRTFVEGLAVVETVLRDDPAKVYATMEFATRDRYRHVVERIAKRSKRSEREVAAKAIALASTQPPGREHHVGYFLIDRGRRSLELALAGKSHERALSKKLNRGLGIVTYVGTITAITVALTWLFAHLALTRRHPLAWNIAWSVVVALVGSQLAISFVHWITTLTIKPRPLPRLDLSSGIPEAHKTLVAVPVMLTSEAGIAHLVELLEVRFLANRDPNLGFALVTDFADATTEKTANDDRLLAYARDAIAALDHKYERGGGFFLFHRARRYNARDQIWMGWERKRGKLEDLNAALRGEPERFAEIVGRTQLLDGMRYVIVLDSDTALPRDAARELIGTLAHPLNRPVIDALRGRVCHGYAILQPRVGITLDSTQKTRFARLFAGEPGIDPYTRVISDVYQDLFAEGSFIGKGIYDIDAVRGVLGDMLPDNRVLSHDLLEGAYGRAGLVSDVIVYEDYPSTYGVDASRRARWIRGDWQIARWLFWRVPTGGAGKPRNPISALSRWKILDNLRRSLVAPAMLALLVIAWTIPGVAVIALPLVLATLLVPPLLSAFTELERRPKELAPDEHVRAVRRQLGHAFLREGFSFACIPEDAALSAGAIARVWIRLWITKRKLLEWKTAAEAERSQRTDFLATYRSMWVAPVVAIAIGVQLSLGQVAADWLAIPVAALWALAPLFVWWTNRTLGVRHEALSRNDKLFLHRLARKTWRFFRTYVTSEDNDLPPDNFQEEPPVGVAHRTSPTNIGVSLLANLAAHDFGYATIGEVVSRTTRTFATLDKLQRFRGHFYNWYDTCSLEPLRPMYVSSVDSGNLAGHLMTLAEGLKELMRCPIVGAQTFRGIADTLGLAGITADEIHELTRLTPRTLGEAHAALLRLATMIKAQPSVEGELAWWRAELIRQIDEHAAELAVLTPDGSGTIPSLEQLARLPGASGAIDRAAELVAELQRLEQHAGELADFDYDFLYDANRHLLAIGYSVTDHRLDNSFYDLLASEARLASFVAIAQNKLPQEHWFHLGRRVTTTGGQPTLLSWSGSMFEYLMPLLVMPTYDSTLLDATYRAAVARQIEYGRQREVPWGISESGYYKTDAHLNYQYRAFGVPGLGFKRGLGSDLVIAPYASAMALMVAPQEATANLERLDREGQIGPHGLYEAVEYTPSRLPPGKSSATVKSYMAHHQGMVFLSLVYTLLDRPMQRRFLANPALRATELVLHERVPKTPPVYPHPAEVGAVRVASEIERDLRVFTSATTPSPEVQLLSNGSYHVMVTNSGGGYSRWRDLEVTRWSEDPTRDHWGQFCYVRDVDANQVWSVAYQPTQTTGSGYEAIFSAGRAEFRRRDDDLDTHVEIAVSPEDDVELRRVSFSNNGATRKVLELTSYAEVVLAAKGADAAHRAFSGLFVQTEIIEGQNAILATRRARSASEKPPWMFHAMIPVAETTTAASFETDRGAFLGRAGSPACPQGIERATLGNSQGSVLDPCVAIRQKVEIAPDQVATVHIFTGVAETRDAALALIDKYRARHLAERVLELAWAHSQVIQRRLDATNAEIRMWDQLASHVVFSTPTLRAPKSIIAANKMGQSGLWQYSISGDVPIVIVRISASENLELVRQLVRAHMYWRLKGLVVDLVIWNEDPSGYRQNLHEQIVAAIAAIGDATLVDQKGGIFIRRTDQMAEADRTLMLTIARAIVTDTAGSLADQLDRRPRNEPVLPVKFEKQRSRSVTAELPPIPRPDLAAANGHGGFTRDGREYVITTTRESRTPAPWSNVMANPYFGTVISETGSAYTWCENAQLYRLTPWSNDPVSDPSGEALYIRDEQDATFWSPTLQPAPGPQLYTTRHGFGYSVFETQESNIVSELTVCVAMDAPVKLFKLKLRNRSGRPRTLSVTGFFELVLGAQRAASLPHVITEVDAKTGALFAKSAYAGDFAPRIAFLECSEAQRTLTGDRTEFLGRGGSPARPMALARKRLSGRVGAAFDPCLAMQTTIELAEGQEREVVFAFGSGRDLNDARYIVGRYRGVAGAQAGLDGVYQFWNRTLGAVHVQTPDESLDFLANGWLLYQVLSARMWGRSGFYQSGGAYGFRDQLQDACAMLHADPALLREQLLRSAAHQFPQGDVQHWWHPPSGRGVRTRISDDFLWMPYAAARYVSSTGDTGVLDDKVDMIEGRLVNSNEESYYDLPARSAESVSLYDHCVRAIKHGLRFGANGLPLMGTGDWNDGMNLVGDEGRGESVWLALFLVEVLQTFEPLARQRGDSTFADECVARAAELRRNIEANAWDGAWYRRGFYDDGAPLGSRDSDECKIDALPQSWATLARVGDPARVEQALASLDAKLFDRELGLIKLFDPPFDHGEHNPGYIKGYVPGVRENGGQYTHAAVWAVMAFAQAGHRDRAWEMFSAIDPVHHGDSPEAIARYRVEPYVMAADIYTNPQHAGRGGWTWYTGSAGWMYRLILESLLGLRLEVDHLVVTPVIPASWAGFKVHYRYRETMHHLEIKGNGKRVTSVVIDGQPRTDNRVPLTDDRREHWATIELG